MAELITRAELQTYAERAGVTGFTNDQFDDAIASATDRLRQAALNDYTAASFEMLTPANIPADMRTDTLAIALAVLTQGDANRAEGIGTAEDAASKRLGYLVGGTTHYDESPGAVLVKRGSSDPVAVGAVTHIRRADRTFERSSTSSTLTFDSIDPLI
jgi:hypothetical protein